MDPLTIILSTSLSHYVMIATQLGIRQGKRFLSIDEVLLPDLLVLELKGFIKVKYVLKYRNQGVKP